MTGGYKAITVIGEGITEKYYIESLRSLAKNNFQITPQELGIKASNLADLEKAISKAIDKGYDEIYCLIDMDSKENGASSSKYKTLKEKYHDRRIVKKKKGIDCYIRFIETKRCTELWFIYYFDYVTRHFASYKEVETYLHKYVADYEKHDRYFKGVKDLHKKMLSCGGVLKRALENARKSVSARDQTDSTDMSYSEMHYLLHALGIEE